MLHAVKTIAVAVALFGAASLSASAMPLPAPRPLAGESAQRLAEPISFRRAHWREVSPCRKGGRYYTYGGGWGCDYYRYSYDWPYGRRR